MITSRSLLDVIAESRLRRSRIAPCSIPKSFIKARSTGLFDIGLCAKELVSVQPMTGPTGLIFYMDYRHKKP